MKIAAAVTSMILATAAFAPAQAPEVQDLDGWRSAKWGMTEAEVIAAFPGEAERLAKPERRQDGGVVTIGIPDYKVGSNALMVKFGFDGKGALERVTLMPPDNLAPGVMHSGVFASLETLLTEKYGPPTTSKSERGGLSGSGPSNGTRVWRRPRTVITLLYTFMTTVGTSKYSDVLILSYAPPSKEADKL